MDTRKSVSVIIPNYNGKHLLLEYLPFTYTAVKNTGKPYEIIIVDDASTDGSADFIRKSYPDIKLIVNTENKGFSYSCNRGIEMASCELTLLLNSDVKLNADYFEHLWKYFLGWDTFGVMGRIIDMEGDHIQDAARAPKFNGFKLKTDYFYYTENQSNRLFTFYLSGANALINTEKLKQIGGFYEIFSPFYCEDMELGIRAWRVKWKSYYEHQAVCRRPALAGGPSKTDDEKLYVRNLYYLHAIHLNSWALTALHLQIILTDLLPKLLTGKTWILGSYKDLLNNRKLLKKYREQVEKFLYANDSHVTVFNVVGKIKLSVKNKRLIRFKP